MNSQQDDVIYGLMNELEEALEKNGMPLLGSFSIVKKDTVTNILDRLYLNCIIELVFHKDFLKMLGIFLFQHYKDCSFSTPSYKKGKRLNPFLLDDRLLYSVQQEQKMI